MENNQENKSEQHKEDKDLTNPKVKENQYTPEEKKFADGEGTKLDEAIDEDEKNPATRGV